jgi:hypothetical protein
VLDATKAELYEFCSDTPQTALAASDHLRGRLGSSVGETEARGLLDELVDTGLTLEEDRRYFSLAIPVNTGW